MKKMIHASLMLLLVVLGLKAEAAHFLPKPVINKDLLKRRIFDGRHFIKKPDLIVKKIHAFSWDHANQRTIIKVTVKNIGFAKAGISYLRIMDHSTHQSTGAPYNAVAAVPALNPGATFTATLYLPYWIFNPDASLEAEADYKGMVQEIRENNNKKSFFRMG